MTLEIHLALLEKIRSNKSVDAIKSKTIATLYRSWKDGLIDEAEYHTEYSNTLYKLSLMVA